VYVADVSGTAGVSRMWSRPNTASGALTQLSSTTSILDAGPILSPDGNTIYATGWDPLNDSAGLQLQSLPNKYLNQKAPLSNQRAGPSFFILLPRASCAVWVLFATG